MRERRRRRRDMREKEEKKFCTNEREKEREEIFKKNEGQLCLYSGFFDKYNQFTNLDQKQ